MAKFNNVEHKEFVAWHHLLQDLMNQKKAWNEMVSELPAANMAQSYQHKVLVISEKFTEDKKLAVEFSSDEDSSNICFYLVDQNGHDDGTRFLCGNRMFSDRFLYTGDKYAADVAGCVLNYLEDKGLIKYQSDDADLDKMTNDMHASLVILKNGTKIFQTSGHGAKFSDGTEFNPTEEEKEAIKRFWGFLQVKRYFSKITFNEIPVGVSESRQELSEDALSMMTALQSEFTDCIFLVPFMVVSAMKEMGVRQDYPRWVAANATAETSREAPDRKVWDINNFAY